MGKDVKRIDNEVYLLIWKDLRFYLLTHISGKTYV